MKVGVGRDGNGKNHQNDFVTHLWDWLDTNWLHWWSQLGKAWDLKPNLPPRLVYWFLREATEIAAGKMDLFSFEEKEELGRKQKTRTKFNYYEILS